MTNLFVVDDQHKSLCDILREILPAADYRIEAYEFDADCGYHDQLRQCLEHIAGRVDIDIVLLDVFFPTTNGDQPLGNGLLLPLFGMGMPVVLTSASEDTAQLIQSAQLAGQCGVELVQKKFSDDANCDRLIEALEVLAQSLRDSPPYFRDNLVSDENYSKEYDVAELSSIGTLFAIEWENERVINTVRTAIQNEVSRTGSKEGIRILDIGCGTGRFEEVLLNQDYAPHIREIVGVDYSPGMLAAGRRRMPNYLLESGKVKFQRRLGERLFRSVEPDGRPFDVVLMCFGVPSFVKDVGAFLEVHRVLCDGGTAIFTVYNRAAANHEFRKTFGQNATDICAVIEFKDGIWQMGPDPNWIRFNFFNVDEFFSVLRTAGFRVDREVNDWATFPTLISCAKKDLVPRQSPTIPEQISYLDRDPLKIGFDHRLYEMDRDYCRAFPETGYYINVVVSK